MAKKKQEITIEKFELYPFVEMPEKKGKKMEIWQETTKNFINLAKKIKNHGFEPVGDCEISYAVHSKKKLDDNAISDSIKTCLLFSGVIASVDQIKKWGKTLVHKDKESRVIISIKEI